MNAFRYSEKRKSDGFFLLCFIFRFTTVLFRYSFPSLIFGILSQKDMKCMIQNLSFRYQYIKIF